MYLQAARIAPLIKQPTQTICDYVVTYCACVDLILHHFFDFIEKCSKTTNCDYDYRTDYQFCIWLSKVVIPMLSSFYWTMAILSTTLLRYSILINYVIVRKAVYFLFNKVQVFPPAFYVKHGL